MLAIDILFDIFNNSARRLNILESYHFTLSDFIEVTGEHDTFGQEEVLSLQVLLAEREGQVASLNQALAEREGRVASLNQALAEREGRVASLNQALAEREGQVASLNQALVEREGQLYALTNSRSWRLTAPLRSLGGGMTKMLRLRNVHSYLVERKVAQSGYFDTAFYLNEYPDVANAQISPLAHYLNFGWKEGRDPSAVFSTRLYLENNNDVRVAEINPLLHYIFHGKVEGRQLGNSKEKIFHPEPNAVEKHVKPADDTENTRLEYDFFRIVPFYLNPHKEVACESSRKIAVHLHVIHKNTTDRCVDFLKNIPLKFDLYVSIPDGCEANGAELGFRHDLPLAQRIIVENVPDRGRGLAPLIIQFGGRMSAYDIVAHFHSPIFLNKSEMDASFEASIRVMCGSKRGVAQIVNLLEDDAKTVFPAGKRLSRELLESSGGSDIAESILARYSAFNDAGFPPTEFPSCEFFWTKASCLRELLALPLCYEDFSEGSVPISGGLDETLEAMLLVLSSSHQGRNYCIESPELSDEPREYYEEQYDFREDIVHDTIKVLAYYLPQFHPTPENDEWHGKGFTEWHKVEAAYPLFHGHYQQHVPHPDIGYYHLDSPHQLEKQAELMHKSGVHGMIFYHYWFSGKLILEKPAQMLIANQNIDMPYCFCWANENWTRRWDGNENEILLGQVYSRNDAREFVRYLIPFFKDERYIRIEGRPVLFVYRPSSIEHCDDYLSIWRDECELSGLKAPYVVATLTRGATAPADYGMDAAVERVLQDWTGGAVPELNDQLLPYWPINGSILDYSAVADHYINKKLDNDYVLFRSAVPVWDNTARYGSEAYALHRFATSKMQQWVEQLINYSEQNLPADRRFVVINAWNEWAEGAHLEPDTRFGYGYLNAIGRALCNFQFNSIDYMELDDGLTVSLELTTSAVQNFRQDFAARDKFLRCLANAILYAKCKVVTDDADLAGGLAKEGVACNGLAGGVIAQYKLLFSDLFVFPQGTIETLLKMALRHPGFDISSTPSNDPSLLHATRMENFVIPSGHSRGPGIELRLRHPANGTKCCPQAKCFILKSEPESKKSARGDRVATIVRFHRNGDRQLLDNAVFSLLAQSGCRVQLYLALQDFEDEEVRQMEAELAALPWSDSCQPVIRRYQSTHANPDLRSLMLNDTLKAVGSGYAAFLDYDDILFPGAYKALINRLNESKKSVTFGRVYSAIVHGSSGLTIRREKTFIHGRSYEDFLINNHAPLHSFLLDMGRIDLSGVIYFDDMKYMEDYYLTLQLFNDKNTDWDSLKREEFIGDYIHRVGGVQNTLAINCEITKSALLRDSEYIKCEQRLNALRKRITTDLQ